MLASQHNQQPNSQQSYNQPVPLQQGGAPWGQPPFQQYPGQGYPAFQGYQAHGGQGQNVKAGGLAGNAMKRASQQSLSRRASGDGQLTVGSIVEQMQDCVDKKGLEAKFYTPTKIFTKAKELFKARAPQLIKQAWGLGDDEASEMGILGLWDVWLLCDDSRSMMEKYNPGREKALKDYVTRMAKAGTLFDSDGINVDFFHSAGAQGVTSEAKVTEVFSKMKNQSGVS
jgi:hypothetical protein